jgi:hypothetical protein
MTAADDLAVRRALELAGVKFIDENGGSAGGMRPKSRSGHLLPSLALLLFCII